MECTVDDAFKFGCGRYIQSERALESLGVEVGRLGRRALLIGGERALEAAGERCESALRDGGCAFDTAVWKGFSSLKGAKTLAQRAAGAGADVVVGIGGGRIMDLAKMVAAEAGLPVVNVPTVSSTCAAFTPLSLVYSDRGETVGSWFFRREVDAVIVDETLLSAQPVRYLTAGMLDSMAKGIEIAHYAPDGARLPYDLALSKWIARHIGSELAQRWRTAKEDALRRTPTPTLKDFFYLLIPETGIVSGCARGAKQSALAHAFYEKVRTRYPAQSAGALHGEIVGVGLRLQLLYLGKRKELRALEGLMCDLGAPVTPADVGAAIDDGFADAFEEHALSVGMIPDRPEERKRLRDALAQCCLRCEKGAM